MWIVSTLSYDWRCFLMVNFKTILTLHYEGVSMRQISSRLLCSRNTVSSVIKSAELNKLTSAEVNSLSEEEVSKRLFPEKEVVPAYVQPDFEHIHKELLKPGTTLSILYLNYSSGTRNVWKTQESGCDCSLF